MTKLLAASVAALMPAFAPAVTTTGQPQAQPDPQRQPLTDSRCHRGLNSIRDYRRYASRVYRRSKVSKDAHRRMRYMRVCQHSKAAAKIVRRFHRRYVRERKARRAARRAARIASSLTPYSCSFGRSAIPCHIVACESGGSWNARNPSGAIGRYQFLGWPVPWPVRTQAHKNAHHRMAARLWAGGRGRGHWAQCL